jgi:WhiB family redox-sensing transcriptional regulator
MDLAWKLEGACRELNPAMFFPASAAEAAPAIEVCALCPVRQRCLEHALAAREWDGVWGGTTGTERRTIARRRRELAVR